MTDTMEVEGAVYGAPIDGIFDGQVFPDGLNKGDKVLVHWSHRDSGYFGGPYDVGSVWATLSGAQFRAPINHPIYGDGYGPEIKVERQPAWLGDDELIHVQWEYGNWYSNGPVAVDCTTHTPWSAIRLPADHWAYVPLAKGFTPWAGGDEAPGDWEPGSEVLFGNGAVEIGQSWAWAGNGDRNGKMLIIGYKPKAPAAWQTSPTYGPDDVGTIDVPAPHSFKAGDYVVASSENDEDLVGKIQILDKATEFSVYFNDGQHDRYCPTAYYRPATPEEIAAYKAVCNDDAPKLDAEWFASAELVKPAVDTVTIPKMTEDEVRGCFHAIYDHSDNFADDDVVTLFRQLGIIKPEPTPIEKFEAHHGGLDNNQRAILEIYQEWSKSNA